jgi:hypothetical protein
MTILIHASHLSKLLRFDECLQITQWRLLLLSIASSKKCPVVKAIMPVSKVSYTALFTIRFCISDLTVFFTDDELVRLTQLAKESRTLNYRTNVNTVFTGFYSMSKSMLDGSIKRSFCRTEFLIMYHYSNLPDTFTFAAPDDAGNGDTIHIICEVTDSGNPPLTRYQRVIPEVSP